MRGFSDFRKPIFVFTSKHFYFLISTKFFFFFLYFLAVFNFVQRFMGWMLLLFVQHISKNKNIYCTCYIIHPSCCSVYSTPHFCRSKDASCTCMIWVLCTVYCIYYLIYTIQNIRKKQIYTICRFFLL